MTPSRSPAGCEGDTRGVRRHPGRKGSSIAGLLVGVNLLTGCTTDTARPAPSSTRIVTRTPSPSATLTRTVTATAGSVTSGPAVTSGTSASAASPSGRGSAAPSSVVAPSTSAVPAARTASCPYLSDDEVILMTGQRHGPTMVTDVKPEPICEFYRSDGGWMAAVRPIQTNSSAAAVAAIDAHIPRATSSPAAHPAGWTGGLMVLPDGDPGYPDAESVYGVSKGNRAVIAWTNRTQTIKSRRAVEATIAALRWWCSVDGRPPCPESVSSSPDRGRNRPIGASGDGFGTSVGAAGRCRGRAGEVWLAAESGRISQVTTLTATLHTNRGDILIELLPNHAPKTVANFVGLANGSRAYSTQNAKGEASGPFYDGAIFHRVIDGFMLQGGDPTGTGRGGPGYEFADEFHPELVFDKPYLLAMANSGPGTNGSQFFITTGKTPHLNFKHTIFGEVTDAASRQVVDAIGGSAVDRFDRPTEDVVINSITIDDDQPAG